MTLVTRGGGWTSSGGCAAKDEEVSSGQSISVKVAHVSTAKASSSTQTTHSCDICGPILKDILYADEHQGTECRFRTYSCGACGRQFWFSANFHKNVKHHYVETPFHRDEGVLAVILAMSPHPGAAIPSQMHSICTGRGSYPGRVHTEERIFPEA